MKFKEQTVKKTIADLSQLIELLTSYRKSHKKKFDKVLPQYKKSAENLLMYKCFRKNDHTKLQKRLGYMGLSRLARAENHILSSIIHNKHILEKVIGEDSGKRNYKSITIKQSEKLLEERTSDLLGATENGRRIRIMVTLPSEAAQNLDLIKSLAESGMNVARINCAHDSEDDWIRMIHNVRKVSELLDRDIKIAMDLAGPKIRTGKLKPGPKVIKINPVKNEFGEVIQPTTVVLTVKDYLTDWGSPIVISREDFSKIKLDEIYRFKDASGKSRQFTVTSIGENYIKASVNQTTYFKPGSKLTSSKNTIVVEDVPAMESPLQLQVGDILEVYKTDIEGEQASYDENGNVLVPSKISCTEPAVIKSLEEGQLIFFDDGKITGEVVRKHDEKVDVKITNAKVTGSKLKADKGINVPFSDIKFSGITEKDKEDLKFVAVHADMVNLSFVNTPEDVYELLDELKKVNAKKELGLVLKIETQAAYNNIFDILIAAMETYPIGVMIARGDLAIETGWNHIGIVQKEILSFCNAAHIPVIWATQVLENLAKKGLPSRSEITDAVTAIKADCVMLNKGPYISRAVGLLDDILTIQQAYQFKNAPYTPELEKF